MLKAKMQKAQCFSNHLLSNLGIWNRGFVFAIIWVIQGKK